MLLKKRDYRTNSKYDKGKTKKKILNISHTPISMESPIGDDEDSTVGDFIEDKNNYSPIEAANLENLREAIKSLSKQV